MSGADVLVKCMEREGVDSIFAYPGGASMPIHQALTRSETIRTILPRHEQGGSFAAEGYARATGRAGVCMATSGPGATNLVTGIADAFLDSTPLIAITGQVPTFMIGRGAFQETDVFGMTAPVVKHSYLITDPADIPRIVKEAFHLAQSGRPGPVLIDIPKDVQEMQVVPEFDVEMDLPGYRQPGCASDEQIETILELIKNAERPMIYSGGGIISGDASKILLEFAERTQIPVATTLMGVGAFPERHELSLKWLGMHGLVAANNAVNEADLLLAIGVRFDDRVTGKVAAFAEHGTIVHIDIDNVEINKNKVVQHPILANIKPTLEALNKRLAEEGFERKSTGFDRNPDWYSLIQEWKTRFPFTYTEHPTAILPQEVVSTLNELTADRDVFITTGVGQHQMWAAQFYDFDEPRRLVTSSGLGSMGYGYPAAVGVKVACPDAEVIDIDGDGSFLMNVQELAMAKVEGIAAKAIILNNQHLGMVVQWEDLKYDSNRAHTFLADPNRGYDSEYQDMTRIYPDFVKMAEAFDVKSERVIKKEDLVPALKRMLESDEPYVLDIMVPYTEHVLPMIPGGMTYKDVILERYAGDGEGKSASELDIPSAL